jgi:hypothetical protein
MTLSPIDFPSIEDYLSKFKTFGILIKYHKKYLKDDQCIYVVIYKLGSAYSIFVYTFYSTIESLGSAYKVPLLSLL